MLLSINGKTLLGMSHQEAVTHIKANTGSKLVTLKIIEAPESSIGPGIFFPSWLYWQQLPKYVITSHIYGILHEYNTIYL